MIAIGHKIKREDRNLHFTLFTNNLKSFVLSENCHLSFSKSTVTKLGKEKCLDCKKYNRNKQKAWLACAVSVRMAVPSISQRQHSPANYHDHRLRLLVFVSSLITLETCWTARKQQKQPDICATGYTQKSEQMLTSSVRGEAVLLHALSCPQGSNMAVLQCDSPTDPLSPRLQVLRWLLENAQRGDTKKLIINQMFHFRALKNICDL